MNITRVTLDQEKCQEHVAKICGRSDHPYECGKCLKICDPAVFLMHQPFDKCQDPNDPDFWSIRPFWPLLCTRCMRCVTICPAQAISVE